jgi:hypothetical protein
MDNGQGHGSDLYWIALLFWYQFLPLPANPPLFFLREKLLQWEAGSKGSFSNQQKRKDNCMNTVPTFNDNMGGIT